MATTTTKTVPRKLRNGRGYEAAFNGGSVLSGRSGVSGGASGGETGPHSLVSHTDVLIEGDFKKDDFLAYDTEALKFVKKNISSYNFLIKPDSVTDNYPLVFDAATGRPKCVSRVRDSERLGGVEYGKYARKDLNEVITGDWAFNNILIKRQGDPANNGVIYRSEANSFLGEFRYYQNKLVLTMADESANVKIRLRPDSTSYIGTWLGVNKGTPTAALDVAGNGKFSGVVKSNRLSGFAFSVSDRAHIALYDGYVTNYAEIEASMEAANGWRWRTLKSGRGYYDAFILSKNGDGKFSGELKLGKSLTVGNGDVGNNPNAGVFWNDNRNYGIYRTGESWQAPNYAQLKIDFPTGIILDGGDSFGKSGVNVASNIQGDGTLNTSFGGRGNWGILRNDGGDTHAIFDRLTVRGRMDVYELVINQIRATNGSLWVSDAVKIKSVELASGTTNFFNCYPHEDTRLSLIVGDKVKLQEFDGRTIRYCIGRITYARTSDGLFTIQRLSGNNPWEGATVVRINSYNNDDRKGALYLTSSGNGSPFMDVLYNEKTMTRVGRLNGLSGQSGYGIWGSADGVNEAFVISSGSNGANGYARIAGWNFDNKTISKNNLYIATDISSYNAANRLLIGNWGTGNAPHIKLIGGATNDYIQIYHSRPDSWGLVGMLNADYVFQLGSTNKIANCNFDNNKIWSNGWCLYSDGSGWLAKQNIKWDAAGNVALGSNVTISWTKVTGTAGLTDDIASAKNTAIAANNTANAVNTKVGNKLTKLTSTGIYTGTLTAEQVNAVMVSSSAIEATNFNFRSGNIGGLQVRDDSIGNKHFSIYSDISGAHLMFMQYEAEGTSKKAALEFRIFNTSNQGRDFAKIYAYCSSNGTDFLRFEVKGSQVLTLRSGQVSIEDDLRVWKNTYLTKRTTLGGTKLGRIELIGHGTKYVDVSTCTFASCLPDSSDIYITTQNHQDGSMLVVVNRADNSGYCVKLNNAIKGTYELNGGQCGLFMYDSGKTTGGTDEGDWFLVGYYDTDW